jgi:hypothetical protein
MSHIIGRGRYARETYPSPPASTTPGGAGGLIVDTIAVTPPPGGTRLVDVDTTSIPDGTKAWVRSVEDWFVLNRTTTLTPDNITVADAIAGGGQWLRKLTPSQRWIQQAPWFIDPANVTGVASDENDGFTGATPLSSDNERRRRWAPEASRLFIVSTVTYMSGGFTEGLSEYSFSGPSTVLAIGLPTTLRAGTLTAGTMPLASGTSLPVIEDTVGGSFAGLINERVRLTTGAGSGGIAWILRDDGGSAATTSAFLTPNGIMVDPAPGDGYVVESLPFISLTKIDGAFAGMDAIDLQINTIVAEWSVSFWIGEFCKLFGNLRNSRLDEVHGCFFDADFQWHSCHIDSILTCVLTRNVFNNSTARIDNESVWLGGALSAVGGSDIRFGTGGTTGGAASGHDVPVSVPGDGALNVGFVPGFALLGRLGRVSADGGNVWGSTNAGFGIFCNAANQALYRPTPPNPFTITGAAGDTSVGGTTKAYGALPFIEPANGAGIVKFVL